MFEIGLSKLLIALAILALFLGGRRLPDLGSNLSKSNRRFRAGCSGAGASGHPDDLGELENGTVTLEPEPGERASTRGDSPLPH